MERKVFRALVCGICGITFYTGGLAAAAVLLEQWAYLVAALGAVVLLCAAAVLAGSRKERGVLLCTVAGAELFPLGIFLGWVGDPSYWFFLIAGGVLMIGAVFASN